MIFILFTITKLINYKLHILFDGEELLEDDKIKEDEEGNTSKDKTDTPKTQDIEETNEDIDVKIDDEPSNTQSSDLKVEEDDFLAILASMESPDPMEDFMNSGENQSTLYDSVQIHATNDDSAEKSSLQKSSTELVTSSPTRSPVGKAVVVDLHSTKVDFKAGKQLKFSI